MELMSRLPNIHPGDVLREEFLVLMGLSSSALAESIGVPAPAMDALCAGQQAMTPDTAARLARFFGTSEKFWLGLQTDFELEEAGQLPVPPVIEDADSPTVVQRLAEGIEQVRLGLQQFLRLTQEGLDDLRATYAPATLRGGDGALAVAIEAAGVEVVVLSVAMKPEGVQLMLRWLRDIPEQPPVVFVVVGDEARSVQVEWPAWDGKLERPQQLRLLDCRIDAETWAARAEQPLLLYRWEQETNLLHLELLPPGEEA